MQLGNLHTVFDADVPCVQEDAKELLRDLHQPTSGTKAALTDRLAALAEEQHDSFPVLTGIKLRPAQVSAFLPAGSKLRWYWYFFVVQFASSISCLDKFPGGYRKVCSQLDLMATPRICSHAVVLRHPQEIFS